VVPYWGPWPTRARPRLNDHTHTGSPCASATRRRSDKNRSSSSASATIRGWRDASSSRRSSVLSIAERYRERVERG
jgi:hypothetical protein